MDLTDEEIKRNRRAYYEPLSVKTGIPVEQLQELPQNAIKALAEMASRREAIEYYKSNPQARREYKRRWDAANREKTNADQRRRRKEKKESARQE